MRRFTEEMDRLFEDVGFGSNCLERPFGGRGELNSFAWSPQIETFQRDNQFVFRADLPGMNKDDLKVSVDDNCLAIRGERKKEWSSDDESSGGYRSERSYGSFYRCVPLPKSVPTRCGVLAQAPGFFHQVITLRRNREQQSHRPHQRRYAMSWAASHCQKADGEMRRTPRHGSSINKS